MSDGSAELAGGRNAGGSRESIAGFEIESVLGEGRHSVVFLCDDGGSKYAVKWQKPTSPERRSVLRRRFAKEAATLARLDHPAFPRVWTTGEADGRPYLVLEALSGRPLDEVLESERFGGSALLKLGTDLARGLRVLHGAEVVHRDLKPANIHWDGTKARIFDLSLIEAPESSLTSELPDGDDRAPRDVVGTLAFAAPEQLRVLKRPVDERSDLYGLGAVLYAAASGHPPFDESDAESLIQAHATRSPRSSHAHLPEQWAPLADLIDRLLAKDPSDRPASAARVLDLFASAEPEGRGVERADDQAESGPREPLVRRFRLVGRHDAHRRLLEGAREVRQSSRGGSAMVRGDEASGRAALVDFFLDDLELDDGEYLRLDGRPEPDRPIHGVRRLIGRLLADDRTLNSRECLNRALDGMSASPVVRRIAWSVLENDSQNETVPDDHLRTGQFLGELARLLARLAVRTETSLLVVDSADRLDLSSRRVMRALLQLLEQWPLFVVLTGEGQSSSSQVLFDRLEGDLDVFEPSDSDGDARGSRYVEISLEPLTRDEVVRFVDYYLNASFAADAFVEQIRATTGGRPGHLERLLDFLVERMVLEPDWEGWRVDRDRLATVELPSDLRGLMTRPLEELDERSRMLLTAAAVWGRRFPIEVVTRVVDLDRREAQSLVERAVQKDLLLRAPEAGESNYEFAHDAIRADLLDEASEPDRRGYHQAYAKLLDARGDWSFLMAHHYAQGDGTTPERTAEVCRRAARRAASEHAAEQTLEFADAVAEAVDRMSERLPPELSYLRGWALSQLEQVDEAIDHLKRAIEEAEDRQRRARYQLTLATIDSSRIRFERVYSTAHEVLAELGETVPKSTFGLAIKGIITYLAVFWHEKLDPREKPSSPGDARLELVSRGYRLLSISAIFTDRPLTGLVAEFGRKCATLKLGPSAELVETYGTSAGMAAIAGDFEGAHEQLNRGRKIAESVDDPYADARLDIAEAWVRHIRGEPIEAAREAASILRDRGDQLEFFERSFAVEDLAVNYGLRGHSDRVIDWYRRWRALHKASSEETVPSTMHSTVVFHARLAGDEELANRQFEISENHFDPDGAPFYWRSHWSVVTMDRVVRRAPSPEVEEALERRLELGDDPGSEAFWGRTFYIYAVYARRYLLDEAPDTELQRRREDLREALSRLEEAGNGHPTFAAHEFLLRADLAARRDDRREAAAHLEEAETLAADTENLWVGWEVARLRHLWARQRRSARRAELWLQEMNRLARAAGWKRRVREPAGISTSTTPATGESPSGTAVDSDSETSARQLDLQRKLNGLLEVSTATSAILDPDEVSRAVVDTAIRVLGAQRGLLFLTESESERTISVDAPDVVRHTGELQEVRDEDGHSSGAVPPERTFSTTIVEEVIRRGEAVVLGSTEGGETIESESIDTAGLRSVVATPMFLEEELFGVLYLDNRLAEGVFDAQDAEVLEAIGQHVPLALRTARSAQLEVEVATERQRRLDAEKLRGFARDVNEMLDISDILARLLVEARETLGTERGWAFSESDGRLVAHARLGENGVVSLGSSGDAEQTDHPRPGAVARKVLDGPAVRSMTEVTLEVRRREPLIADGDESWLAASLDSGDDTVGLVVLSWSEPRAFEAADLEFGLALAGQAGVAVEKTRLATVDPLTNIYNRRKFFEFAEDEFYRAKRYDKSLSTLLLDLDDFSAINDRYGHAAGDAVLLAVADRIRQSVRQSDVVARYGGEEFALLLPSTELSAARKTVAERVRTAIADEPFKFEYEAISVTTSVGVSRVRRSDDDVRDVIERADQALYDAKRAGKNTVRSADLL